eukprot:576601-Pelagomonas_calceolata.AAC.1
MADNRWDVQQEEFRILGLREMSWGCPGAEGVLGLSPGAVLGPMGLSWGYPGAVLGRLMGPMGLSWGRVLGLREMPA